MDFKGTWDKKLPLIEFSYNNSFHASIGMAPYEALYGRRCRSPVHWYETREKELVSTDFIRRTTEAVKLYANGWKLHLVDRRVTPTNAEDRWNFKKETLFFSRLLRSKEL